MADTVNPVDRFWANVERANVRSSRRDLTLAALCFMRATFLTVRFPVAFSEKTRSVPDVFYPGSCLRSSDDVLGAALQSRLDFSIINPFTYSRAPSEHSYSPRFGSHIFRGGGVPSTVAAETISPCWVALPPLDAVGRLALAVSTSSHINRRHEGTSIHARTL